MRQALALWALILSHALSAPGAEAAAPMATLGPTAACGELPAILTTFTPVAGSRIVSARLAPEGPGGPSGSHLPEHCEVFGELERRTGVDGQSYAIRFHLRLPTAWNQRFFFQGGGGSNGEIGDALGNLMGSQPRTALQLGYAVVSQDSGHDNAVNTIPSRGGAVSFGFDPVARANYAGRSLPLVSEAAKAIVARYYGQAPAYAYFVGCSKGGQEGMVLAERYPSAFNGIIANAPGFALPRAAIEQALDTQSFAALARRQGHLGADGAPLLGASFSDANLQAARAAILAECDRLDGLADGIVPYGACETRRVLARLKRSLCARAGADDCLSQDQIRTLAAVFTGHAARRGGALYSSSPMDPGLGGLIDGEPISGWRRWKIGGGDPIRNDALNITLGGASLATVFMTPPRELNADPSTVLSFQLGFDPARDTSAIYRTEAPFDTSAWDLMSAQRLDRSAFNAAGGRMIVVQGVSDPVFSIDDTARWWRRLSRAAGGHGADHVRLFPVPGMGHCSGGPATAQFDEFAALVAWVEQGRAPDEITATAGPGTPWPGRTRPLCAYPAIARYDGRGDPERAESFACAAAPRHRPS